MDGFDLAPIVVIHVPPVDARTAYMHLFHTNPGLNDPELSIFNMRTMITSLSRLLKSARVPVTGLISAIFYINWKGDSSIAPSSPGGPCHPARDINMSGRIALGSKHQITLLDAAIIQPNRLNNSIINGQRCPRRMLPSP